MAVQRVEVASPDLEDAVAELLVVEARAHRVGDWWSVEVDIGDKPIAVQVRSIEDVDLAVNRVLSQRPHAPHPAVRVHIYWYH